MSDLGGLCSAPCAILVDTFFSAVLVAPLVVGYWRGTWFLLDTFLYPEDLAISCWISLLLGFTILLLATWFQCWLQDFVTKRGPCLFFILSRLYTIILCLGCVNHWRGVWSTLDIYTGTGWTTAALSVTVGVTGLIGLKAFRNVFAPPFVIIIDGPEDYFTFPTMFRTADSKVCHLIILDGLFSVTVVGSLVVLVWRGSFLILDLIMFPNDAHWSAIGSAVLGYSTSLLIFALQAPMASFCSRATGFRRLAVLDLHAALSYVGAVNVWRGVWYSFDLYLLPDHKVLSCLVTHVAGLVVLSLCYCAHSILVRGVYLDDDDLDAAAAILPYQYVRYFIQKMRRRREATVDGVDQHLNNTRHSAAENGWLPEEVESMMEQQSPLRLSPKTNKESTC